MIFSPLNSRRHPMDKAMTIFRIEITFDNEIKYKIEELKLDRIEDNYIYYYEKNGKYWRDTCDVDEIFLSGDCQAIGFTLDTDKVENIVHRILWEMYSRRKKNIQKIQNDCDFLITEIADKRKTVRNSLSQLKLEKK